MIYFALCHNVFKSGLLVMCQKTFNLPLAIFLATAPSKLSIFRCCPIWMSILSSDNKVIICSLSVQSERSKHKGHINPFPHTTILQQTTLNVFCQNIENLRSWMDNLWQKVENIVAKGEIARFVQFLLLTLCFQKAICWRGVRKRLYEGKG